MRQGYGFFLQDHIVALTNGTDTTGWQAHRACMNKGSPSLCVNTTFTPELYLLRPIIVLRFGGLLKPFILLRKHCNCFMLYRYEDDFTAANAIKLIKRAPTDRPWFLHVSFPGPHDPFLVTTDMRNAASDGREWPQPTDDPQNVRTKLSMHRTRAIANAATPSNAELMKQGTPGGACSPVTAPTGARTRCNYAAEIENLDRLFQLVIDQVEESGYKNNTVICIASDQ